MKLKVISAVFAISLPVVSVAQEGVHYFLPRVAAVKYDALPANADPIGMLGLYYGYSANNFVSFELEGNIGMLGGKFDGSSNPGGSTGSGAVDAWNVGGFASFRHPLFRTDYSYVKAKVGAVYDKPSIETTTVAQPQLKSGAQIALGLGGGYVFKNNITLEVEYVRLKDISHTINFGFHFSLD